MVKEPRKDSKLGFLDVTSKQGKDTPQNDFISQLVKLLWEGGYKNINYDHITTTIPNEKLRSSMETGRQTSQ